MPTKAKAPSVKKAPRAMKVPAKVEKAPSLSEEYLRFFYPQDGGIQQDFKIFTLTNWDLSVTTGNHT